MVSSILFLFSLLFLHRVSLHLPLSPSPSAWSSSSTWRRVSSLPAVTGWREGLTILRPSCTCSTAPDTTDIVYNA